MTNTEMLIESIVRKLRREVESFVEGMSADEDDLDKAEGAARRFAQACGGVVFNAHIQACLAAQQYGFVGDTTSMPNGGRANFERYEERWV